MGFVADLRSWQKNCVAHLWGFGSWVCTCCTSLMFSFFKNFPATGSSNTPKDVMCDLTCFLLLKLQLMHLQTLINDQEGTEDNIFGNL